MLPKVLERRRKFLFGVGGCAFLISFFVYLEPVKHNMLSAPPKLPFNSNSTSTAILATDELSTESPPNSSKETRTTKRILFWTTFFGVVDFYFGLGRKGFKNCPVNDCETTNQRQLLSDSDAIIFHGRDLNRLDLPNIRSADQRWIFLLYESPLNSPDFIAYFNDMFNWTMTYRTDSDIFRSYSDTIYDWPRQDNETVLGERLRKKDKLVAWFVSHCTTHSKREDVVKELQKYLEVDIYGACGPKKCADRPKCNEMLANEYKFYLSFENSLCRDYVTEKFYGALAHSVVPVVYGGVDYTQFAPKGSFIDVRHFSSAKELADYLLYLNKNQTAYEQYFEWRKTYDFQSGEFSWCKMCEMLHDTTLPSRSYSSIYRWWTVEGRCGNDQPPIETSRPELSFVWKNRTNNV